MNIKSCIGTALLVTSLLAVYACQNKPSESKTAEVLPSKHFLREDAYDGIIVKIGTKVRINAEGLVQEGAKGTTISYGFKIKPSSSHAVLSGTNSYAPTFIVDVPGEYIVQASMNTGGKDIEKYFEVVVPDPYPINERDFVRIPPGIQPGDTVPNEVMPGQHLSKLELRFVVNRDIRPGDRLLMEFEPLGGEVIKEKTLGVEASTGDKILQVTPVPMSRIQNRGLLKLEVPIEGIRAGSIIRMVITGGKDKGFTITDKPFEKFISYLFIQKSKQPLRVKSRYELLPFNLLFNGEMVGVCILKFTRNKLDHISVIAPSYVVSGKPFVVLVRPEDRFNYLSKGTVTRIVIHGDDGVVEKDCTPVPKSSACTFTQIIKKSGLYRLTVKDVATGFTNTTNPIISGISLHNLRPYWGAMHGHTVMSYDAIGSLDDYYRQMREETLLDFGAASDHALLLAFPKSAWTITKQVVKRLNEPGKFVTFLGYEWGDWTGDGDGDKCVYYLDDDRPMYYHARYYDTDLLFRALDENHEKVLVIPHHTAVKLAFNDWSNYNPKYERLVEIYQVRGSFECGGPCAEPYSELGDDVNPVGYVKHALELGWRVGFTAGGDDHYGTAGINGPREARTKDGLMSVLADDLTRKALWNGMWNRRVVATTGERILLDYRVNGNLFGSELSLAEHPELAKDRKIGVEVHGTAPLEEVEIIRNNKVVYSKAMDKRNNILDLNFTWHDKSHIADIALSPTKFSSTPFVFYYVRVRQYNDEMAWASPLWINLDTKGK